MRSIRRRSSSSPPGATVISTAEFPCSATPTVAVRCVCLGMSLVSARSISGMAAAVSCHESALPASTRFIRPQLSWSAGRESTSPTKPCQPNGCPVSSCSSRRISPWRDPSAPIGLVASFERSPTYRGADPSRATRIGTMMLAVTENSGAGRRRLRQRRSLVACPVHREMQQTGCDQTVRQ